MKRTAALALVTMATGAAIGLAAAPAAADHYFNDHRGESSMMDKDGYHHWRDQGKDTGGYHGHHDWRDGYFWH
ncbi:hypothetical protein [Nocardiopsis sp. FIRDI 009]|uniref:hypothetical protein n=1 Tax=Nocardiopsis sp. FIRDI 009 TaxID=714197 RepID=UPI0013005FBF|nr:hypothetical protein [Nocardiopsis sp. FIRDI 009]